MTFSTQQLRDAVPIKGLSAKMHIFPKYRVTEKRNAKRDEAIGLKWPFQAKITDRSAICHVSTY